MNWWKRLVEDFRAWKRDEKRINGASRGRCFEKKNPCASGSAISIKGKPKLEIIKMKVIRSDGSEEEIDNG